MKISTKARYALRIMLDLAQHKDEGYISLMTVAKRQDISKNYLDQIMILLNKTDFFKSVRGAQGGYKLAKEPNQYTLGDIVTATDGDFAPLACLKTNTEPCAKADKCIARTAWAGLHEAVAGYLNSVTLQDILDKYDGLLPDNSVFDDESC